MRVMRMHIYQNVYLVQPCELGSQASSDTELRLHVIENLWNDPLECSCGKERPHCGRCGRFDIFVRPAIPEETKLMCGCVVLCDSIRCRRCGWTGPVIRQCRIGIEKKEDKAEEKERMQQAEEESEYVLIKELISKGIRPKLEYVRQLEDRLKIPEERRIPPEMLR
jgi:hypothetical protein